MTYYKFALSATFFAVLLFSYMILVSIVGFFRALVTTWMGDDTAKDEGFLTINPGVHIDPLGALLLVFFGFGWGRFIPFNPNNLHKPYRWLKLLCILFSTVVGYLIIALAGIICLGIIIGKNLSSSIVFSLATVLKEFISLSFFLATIDLVVNSIFFAILLVVDHYQEYVQQAFYAILIVPMIIFLFFGNHIQVALENSIIFLASCIASLISRG